MWSIVSVLLLKQNRHLALMIPWAASSNDSPAYLPILSTPGRYPCSACRPLVLLISHLCLSSSALLCMGLTFPAATSVMRQHNRIIADCLTGPEPKLAEGSTVGASRQLMKKGWKVGGHQIIRQEHSVFLCSSRAHVFFSFRVISTFGVCLGPQQSKGFPDISLHVTS